MNCAQFRDLTQSKNVVTLTPEELRVGMLHYETCAQCNQWYRQKYLVGTEPLSTTQRIQLYRDIKHLREKRHDVR